MGIPQSHLWRLFPLSSLIAYIGTYRQPFKMNLSPSTLLPEVSLQDPAIMRGSRQSQDLLLTTSDFRLQIISCWKAKSQKVSRSEKLKTILRWWRPQQQQQQIWTDWYILCPRARQCILSMAQASGSNITHNRSCSNTWNAVPASDFVLWRWQGRG